MKNCIRKKESWQIRSLPYIPDSFFRALSTDYVRLYPGTQQMLASLKKKWTKKVYLLSNAQRIFTAYEMNVLGITKYF